MDHDVKELAQQHLAGLLSKLGIKSASAYLYQYAFQWTVTNAVNNLGTPDRLYMDMDTLNALSGILKK